MSNRFKRFLLLALLTFTAAPAFAEVNRIELTSPLSQQHYSAEYIESDYNQITDKVTYQGKKRSYQFYAPTMRNKDPRPVIILLHGAKRSGKSMIAKWMSIADSKDVILIAPDAIDGIWTDADNWSFFNKLIKRVENGYSIDHKRIYMFGHSLGGHLAIVAAINNAQNIAAAAIHAGALKSYSPLSRLKPGRKTPILLINGEDDSAVPLNKVEKSAEILDANGHETSLIVINDHNHWYYDIADFINDEAWDFLEDFKL